MAEIARPVARTLSEGTRAAAREALTGRRRGLRALLPFAGPAFIASVAYMDPGNFATNIQGGAMFGYKLLWVVVFANLTAMLLQSLSAKLGIATGRNLAEVARDEFARPVVIGMWLVSEVGAMATDLAESLGAVIALYLLFHVPLLAGALITFVATYAILLLQRRGFRPIEAVIAAMVGVMAISYLIESVLARPAWGEVLRGATTPWLGSQGAVLLAVGVIGATVMPHAIYVHAGLTQDRIPVEHQSDRRKIARFSNLDVLVALGLAGLINLAMMYMAAATFHPHHHNVADISTAYQTLIPLLGGAAAGVFLVSLLASGLSSSAVGTMAGQVIIQGFVRVRIPIWLRRLITMVPTIIVIAIGVNPTEALVLSQVVLSLVLPVPVVALVLFTRRRDLMGDLVNRRLTSVAAAACGLLIVALNVVLLVTTLKPG
ncbi:MAG TPA: Nramp family divalent metal transporter [Candidatus Dormibacteraeota bacterium]